MKVVSKCFVIPAWPLSTVEMKAGIYLFLVASLMCCNTKTFDSEKKMMAYLQDEPNGYTQHKSVNGVDFTLMYRPTDLLVQQELSDASTSSAQVEKLRDKYNKYMYFNLSMSKNNKELLSVAPKNRNEFGQMVNQLAFGMGEKVHVYTPSKDTLEITDFVYPRMYGMSRSTSIMFVYPRDEKALQEDYLNFTIEDLGLFTGEVRFKVPTEYIDNELKLSFK